MFMIGHPNKGVMARKLNPVLACFSFRTDLELASTNTSPDMLGPVLTTSHNHDLLQLATW